MKHRAEPYSSVPELCDQIMEDWYEQEWGDQADTPAFAKVLQAIMQIARLPRLNDAEANPEPAAAPRSNQQRPALKHQPDTTRAI